MLINPDGSYSRDIDIDELRISFGDHYGKRIVLTKEKITYQNTVHPTKAYMRFADGYFDTKEHFFTPEQFKMLSDLIHDAGLLDLLHQQNKPEIYPGAIYQTLSCVFDDGARYIYQTRGKPDKKFDNIVEILLPLCDFQGSERIPEKNEITSKNAYYETICCNAVVSSEWLFCPKCGKKLAPLNVQETDRKIDLEETLWLCRHCREGVSQRYQYCGRCGRKRIW